MFCFCFIYSFLFVILLSLITTNLPMFDWNQAECCKIGTKCALVPVGKECDNWFDLGIRVCQTGLCSNGVWLQEASERYVQKSHW